MNELNLEKNKDKFTIQNTNRGKKVIYGNYLNFNTIKKKFVIIIKNKRLIPIRNLLI